MKISHTKIEVSSTDPIVTPLINMCMLLIQFTMTVACSDLHNNAPATSQVEPASLLWLEGHGREATL